MLKFELSDTVVYVVTDIYSFTSIMFGLDFDEVTLTLFMNINYYISIVRGIY